MAGNHLHHLLIGMLLISSVLASPYLSPRTLRREFPRMIEDFKIFAYSCDGTNSSRFREGSPSDLFHSWIMSSRFLSADPEDADLFYITTFSGVGPRSISRSIRRLRAELPYWNRTLGADHFFVTEDGIGESSDRNLVELRKNAIQISPFPATPSRFIPHKDLTLPSSTSASPPESLDATAQALMDEIRTVPGLIVVNGHRDPSARAEIMSTNEFCLFFHGYGGDLPIGEAMKAGCVPIVVSDRPILDLPFSDVVDWSEIALFVALQEGGGFVRRAIDRIDEEKRARMRASAAQVSSLFRFEDGFMEGDREPRDAFHAVIFQLWRRRHTIRYARWGEAKVLKSTC